ncbi:MAG: hypothetical protein HFI90_06975 [Clostridia bacterium]|nr:hypothetical protein [Clostridia bacterium]
MRPLTKTEIEQRFTDNVAVYVRIGDDNQLIPAILDTTDRGSFAIWCSDSKEWLCISSYGDRWVAYDYSGGEPVCGKEFEMQEGIE